MFEIVIVTPVSIQFSTDSSLALNYQVNLFSIVLQNLQYSKIKLTGFRLCAKVLQFPV